MRNKCNYKSLRMISILWLCSKPFWILLSRPNFVWQPEILLAVYQLQGTIFPSEVHIKPIFFSVCQTASYKGIFIRNFIRVIITKIKMSNYDPQ